MRIWIDAQLPPSIANWINQRYKNVEAKAVRELGLRDALDPEIFEEALCHRQVAKIFLAVLLVIILSPLSIYAQVSPDTLLSYRLDSLVVESVRLRISSANAPLSLETKTRSLREITGSAPTSLASITQHLAGVWVSDRNIASLGERIIIRGVGWRSPWGVRGIQVVLNGIPITVADGSSVTNIIDPAFVTHVELIRGPAGSYWGNSSGGVLYFSTLPNYNKNNHFLLRLYGGSYNSRKVDFRFYKKFAGHRLSAYSSYAYSGGYRQYNASKILRSGVMGSITFSDQSHLEYRGAFAWKPLANYPGSLTARQVKENPQQADQENIATQSGEQATQAQAGFSYYRSTPAGLLTLTAYGIHRDVSNPLPFAIITVNRWAGGFRGSLDKTIHNWDFKIGGEIKFQRDDRVEYENNSGNRGAPTVNQTEKVSNQALFATIKYAPGDFSILGSLRYDRLSFSAYSPAGARIGKRVFHAISPSVGVSYHPGSFTMYSNVSTSFQAPTTSELGNRPGNNPGFNPNLKPENTISLEIGSRGWAFNHFLEYDISLYQMWIRDLLLPYQLKPNGPIYYRNSGKTRHKGINILSAIHPLRNFSFQVAYSLANAKFVKARTLSGEPLKGKFIPGIAEHRVSATLQWLPKPFWLELQGQFVSSYPINNLNTAYNDRYFTVDFKFSYKKIFKNSGVIVTPFININNIFDTQYSGSVVVNASGGDYYLPAPGRNWQTGITFKF